MPGTTFKRLGFAALAACMSTHSAIAEELTISVWGGFYGENWKKDVVDPWSEETGIDVTMDFGQSSTRLSKVLATRGRSADIIFLTDHQMAILDDSELLDAIDWSNVPNSANLYDFARDPLNNGKCPASTLLGVGLAYNTNHFDSPPSSWLDVTRPDLQTRAAFMDMSFSVAPSVMTHFATLQGGDMDNMDAAFNMLAEQAETARIFQLFEVIDWINQDEVSVAPMLNIFAKEDPQLPLRFVYPDDGILGVVNMMCILKDSPNKAAAERFIDFYLSQEIQEMQAKIWGEGPVVTNAALPEVSAYKLVPVEDISKVIFYDPSKIASNRAEWMSRFEEEVLAQ
ncbi:MAG: extracellular solute-binding protein [Alphaproteobacteria bacterium]